MCIPHQMLEEIALDWVNEVRLRHCLIALDKLRPGRKYDAGCCPVATSLAEVGGVAVCSQWISWIQDSRSEYERVPTKVGEFITKFDRGKFPELEAKEGLHAV